MTYMNIRGSNPGFGRLSNLTPPGRGGDLRHPGHALGLHDGRAGQPGPTLAWKLMEWAIPRLSCLIEKGALAISSV